MKRFIISCCLVFLVAAAVLAQSTSGTTNKPEPSHRWATPNEIAALSNAISLAEVPMTFPEVRDNVWGDLKPKALCIYGRGDEIGISRHYWAITEPSDGKPHYGVVLKTKRRENDTSDDDLVSMQLYYEDEHGMRFYDQGENFTEDLKKTFRKIMKQEGKTPWQMGVILAKSNADYALLKYETKKSPNGKGLVGRKYPLPLIDAQVDSVVYPPEGKVPEPKKVAQHAVAYPYEMKRSAISGKVVLCVKTNEAGYAVRIAVKESTHEVFERYAIAHALQTIWESRTKNTFLESEWFESEVVFDVEKLAD